MNKGSTLFLLSLMSTAVSAALNYPMWGSDQHYGTGEKVTHNGDAFKALWGNQRSEPDPTRGNSEHHAWILLPGGEADDGDTGEAPAFEIRSPQEGAIFQSGEPIYVSLFVNPMEYKSATLLINGEIVAELPAGQLEYYFTPEVPEGPFTLAVAFRYGDKEKVLTRNLFMDPADSNNGYDPTRIPQPSPVTSPFPGQHYPHGEQVLVKVDVPEGVEREITLRVDGIVQKRVSKPPYKIAWQPNRDGYFLLEIEENDLEGLLHLTTYLDIYVDSVNANKIVTVTSDLPERVSVLAGQPMTLSVGVTEGEAEFVRFLINGTPLYNFTQPPYTLEWAPPQIGSYAFAVEATPKGYAAGLKLPELTSIGAVTKEALSYCRTEVPIWQAGITYAPDRIVRHDEALFSAKHYTSADPASGAGQWEPITCYEVLDQTRISAFINTPEGSYRTGDQVTLQAVVNLPAVLSGIFVDKFELFRGKEKLADLTAPYTYTYIFPEGNMDDDITYRVTNNLGMSVEETTRIFRDTRVPVPRK